MRSPSAHPEHHNHVIGQDKRGEVLAEEIGIILEETMFSPADADFLVEIERLDAAETYVMDLVGQLNGDFYGGLLPLAEAMEQDGRPLCASVVYRALLDSILRRAASQRLEASTGVPAHAFQRHKKRHLRMNVGA